MFSLQPHQMATTINSKISVKLLIDKNSRKVLFAEAGKDFVDFLFGLMELPLGTVLALLVEHGIAAGSGSGSLGRVYESVQNLDDDYLQTTQIKDSLLRPTIAASSNTTPTPLLKQMAFNNENQSSSRSPQYYGGCRVNSGRIKVSNGRAILTFGSPHSYGGGEVEGYVKGGVTYMVMDDLLVKPISTISSVTLLNALRVKDLSCLQEKTVEIDMDKGLKLLKASFHSTTILTDVFLMPPTPTPPPPTPAKAEL